MQRDTKDYQAHYYDDASSSSSGEAALSLRKKARDKERAGRVEFYRRRTTPVQHAITITDNTMHMVAAEPSSAFVAIVASNVDGLQSTVARIRDQLFGNEQLTKYAQRQCEIRLDPNAPSVTQDVARDVVQFEAVFCLSNRCASTDLSDDAVAVSVAEVVTNVLATTRMPITARYCVSALANLAAHASAARAFLFDEDRLARVVRHIEKAPDDVLWLLSNMAVSETTGAYKLARLIPTVVAHLGASREAWWTVYNLCTHHTSLAHSFQQAAIFDTALRVLDAHAATRNSGDSAVVFLALNGIVLNGHALRTEAALGDIVQKHVIERFLVNAPQLNDTGIEQACGLLVALARSTDDLFAPYAAQVYRVFVDRDVRRAALHVRELFACVFMFAAQRALSRDALDVMCCVLESLITRSSEQDTHTLLAIVSTFYTHLRAASEHRKVLEENGVADLLEPLIERIGKAKNSPRVWRDIRGYALDVVRMLNSEQPDDDEVVVAAAAVDECDDDMDEDEDERDGDGGDGDGDAVM